MLKRFLISFFSGNQSKNASNNTNTTPIGTAGGKGENKTSNSSLIYQGTQGTNSGGGGGKNPSSSTGGQDIKDKDKISVHVDGQQVG